MAFGDVETHPTVAGGGGEDKVWAGPCRSQRGWLSSCGLSLLEKETYWLPPLREAPRGGAASPLKELAFQTSGSEGEVSPLLLCPTHPHPSSGRHCTHSHGSRLRRSPGHLPLLQGPVCSQPGPDGWGGRSVLTGEGSGSHEPCCVHPGVHAGVPAGLHFAGVSCGSQGCCSCSGRRPEMLLSSTKCVWALFPLANIPTHFSTALSVGSVPVVLGAVGFTGTGITASSIAAKMMSAAAIANGGGVAAGSLVATLQSVGAAGLSASSNILLGSAGSALGAWLCDVESWLPSSLGGGLVPEGAQAFCGGSIPEGEQAFCDGAEVVAPQGDTPPPTVPSDTVQS